MKWRFSWSSAKAVWSVFLLLIFPSSGGFLSAQEPPAPSNAISDKDKKFFENAVRPILIEHCYACHSKDSGLSEGGLRVDTRDRIRKGGSAGPAVVPGDPKSSLLLRAISYEDKDMAMPPPDAGEKLSDDEIKILEKWIRSGAPDPRDEIAGDSQLMDYSNAKQWWAFQPIQRPTIPSNVDTSWCYNDIDRFVWKSYQEKGLKPVADAEARTLLRRIYFDLVGIPPNINEINAFDRLLQLGKTLPTTTATVVDSLLQSDQFGMHWGRHWLDVARYAESSGRDVNVAYPHAWRYRDYVIDAFNNNMPYDQFLREQIAGDLLEATSENDRNRMSIATGFLAIGSKSLNERNPRQFAVDMADEQIDTVFQASMALTVACARCHDHKFDPISQKEYTAVAGIFLSTHTKFGTTGGPQTRNSAPLIELSSRSDVSSEPLTPEQVDEMKKQLEQLKTQQSELVAERRKTMRDGNNPAVNPKLLRVAAQIADLEGELSSHRSDGSAKALAMAVSDKTASAPRFASRPRQNRPRLNLQSGFDSIADSPLFVRGDITKASAKVPRGLPNLFDSLEPVRIPYNQSGRRELAEWIVSRQNPMTARVAVNRIWYWMFGQGLVSSLDNFGTTGTPPSHPELLDYLATKFMASGWDTKALIREIAASHTYQLSSNFDETNSSKDADNAFLWRANRRWLAAESIRDAMLSASGTLDGTPQVGSLIARSGDGQVGGQRDRGIPEARITDHQSNARSVYLPLPRSIVPESLEVFDLPDGSAVQTLRESTNVPSQSLFLLNNPFCATQAKELALRILETHPGKSTTDDFAKRLTLAFQLTFARDPNSDEILAARKLVAKLPNNPKVAWTSIARSLFAAAEFRYID